MSYFFSGLIFFILGWVHLIPAISKLDSRLTQRLQHHLESLGVIALFQELWFFGRTPFAVIILLLLMLIKWQQGVISLGIFIIVVGIELLFKRNLKRSRPFQIDQNIKMLQPSEPLDSSFPSGDVLRIWYLIIITGTLLGGQGASWVGLIALGLLVSLGRMVMGVHYFSDVLAGAGLGLVGAGTTIWLWQYLILL